MGILAFLSLQVMNGFQKSFWLDNPEEFIQVPFNDAMRLKDVLERRRCGGFHH